MFYATVVVCLIGVGACDVDQATWAEQSGPTFGSAEECFRIAQYHFKTEWNAHPTLAGQSPSNYKVAIYCTQAGVPL